MLTQPGATRFATVDIGLRALARNESAVQHVFLSAKVKDYVRANRHQRASTGSMSLEDRFQEAKVIAFDDNFWIQVKGKGSAFCVLCLGVI